MYRNILIPTDGSEQAETAVEHGLDVAKQYDATVHSLYVIENIYSADFNIEQVLDTLEAEGKTVTDGVAERAREAGLDAVTSVQRGTPASVIVDYAADNDVDLVVMGTHGRTGVGRFLLGSVTERVVRTASVPVMTVQKAD